MEALTRIALTALLAVLCGRYCPPVEADPSVVPIARTAIGTPYVWGGESRAGMDCSGLVRWAYAQIGVSLPHSSQALAVGGQPVARADLEPGDIVTFYPGATHAALYSGDGMVIHASGRVAEVPLDMAGPFHSGNRY